MDTWPWFATPLLALIAGIAALAPLGVQVVARGVVFIDLAVAQGAAAAALWTATVIDHPSTAQVLFAAVAGGAVVAALVALLVRRRPAEREALIGLIYVIGAALAALGARLDPHGRERWAQLLAADILWVGVTQGVTLGVLAAGVWLLAAAMRGKRWSDALFYPSFAVVASLSVPALGLFIVFVALIVPALWHRIGMPLWVAVTASCGAASIGLGVSWVFDGPSGSWVALAIGTFGVAVAVVRGPARYTDPHPPRPDP